MKKWLIKLLIVPVLIGLGYLSNFVTKSACEQKIARWICFEVLENQEVYTLPGKYPTSFMTVKQVGARVRRYQPKPNDYYEFDGFPWVAVDKAVGRFPYIVKVRWGYNSGDLSGAGGETTFLCLFGIPIQVMGHSSWVS